jgi:hypothetical protein
VPPERSWSGKPVSANAWLHTGFVATDSPIGQETVASADLSRAAFADRSEFGIMRLDFDEGNYEFAFPEIPVTGTTRSYGPAGETSEVDQLVGWADAITRRAAAGDGPEGATTPTESGEYPSARFDLADAGECGSRIGGSVDLAIGPGDDGIVPATFSSIPTRGFESGGSSSDGDTGTPTSARGAGPSGGTARVQWEVVPRDVETGSMSPLRCE